VRFRRGFGEPPEETSKSKEKQADAPAARKTPIEEINAALVAQYPITALPVAIALNYLDTAQYGGTLTTTIKVGTSSLTLEKQDNVDVALLDVAGLVLNDKGKSISSFNKRFTIKPSATNTNKKPPENIFYNDFALVKPGLYQVRVAAVDVRTGTRGSAYQWIDVPDVTNKELTLSTLIVGERKIDLEGQPIEGASNDPHQPEPFKQVTVNVDQRFASSSYLRFLTFIYNAATGSTNSDNVKEGNTVRPISLPGKDEVSPTGKDGVTFPGKAGISTAAKDSVTQPTQDGVRLTGKDSNAAPGTTSTTSGPTSTATLAAPDLAVQVQVFRDNEPVITAPLHKIPTEGTFDAQRVPYAADVPLKGLQPGAYVLQVTVIDRLAKASATRKFSFYIE